MPDASDNDLLDVVLDVILDSWDRNNRILVNLLLALPEGGLEARALAAGNSVADMFTHVNYVRLIFLVEDAPEFALPQPPREWLRSSREQLDRPGFDTARLAADLNLSANAVREAVRSRIAEARPMNLHYDHPVLFLQHMIWHEGYHHGQIKLALKAVGLPLDDEKIGPLTWGLWLRKTVTGVPS